MIFPSSFQSGSSPKNSLAYQSRVDPAPICKPPFPWYIVRKQVNLFNFNILIVYSQKPILAFHFEKVIKLLFKKHRRRVNLTNIFEGGITKKCRKSWFLKKQMIPLSTNRSSSPQGFCCNPNKSEKERKVWGFSLCPALLDLSAWTQEQFSGLWLTCSGGT